MWYYKTIKKPQHRPMDAKRRQVKEQAFAGVGKLFLSNSKRKTD